MEIEEVLIIWLWNTRQGNSTISIAGRASSPAGIFVWAEATALLPIRQENCATCTFSVHVAIATSQPPPSTSERTTALLNYSIQDLRPPGLNSVLPLPSQHTITITSCEAYFCPLKIEMEKMYWGIPSSPMAYSSATQTKFPLTQRE